MVYRFGIEAQATVNVKCYNLFTSITTLAILPISYVGYLVGWIAESIYVVAIIMSLIGIPLRLYWLKRLVYLNSQSFIKQVIIKIFYISVVAVCLPLFLHYLVEENMWTVAFNFIISFLSAGLSIFYLGLSDEERLQVNKGIKKIISKVR